MPNETVITWITLRNYPIIPFSTGLFSFSMHSDLQPHNIVDTQMVSNIWMDSFSSPICYLRPITSYHRDSFSLFLWLHSVQYKFSKCFIIKELSSNHSKTDIAGIKICIKYQPDIWLLLILASICFCVMNCESSLFFESSTWIFY